MIMCLEISISEFFGLFFGVLTPFALERVYYMFKNRSNRIELLQSLRSELENCRDLLKGKENLLPTAMWRSATSSGSIMLLSYNQRVQIASVYNQIENYNYEATRERDVSTMAETTELKNPYYLVELLHHLRAIEKSLRKEIDILLQKKWFKEDP